MPLELLELFPDEDYRFHLTLRKGDLRAFFAATDPQLLAARKTVLAEAMDFHAGCLEGAEPLLSATEACFGIAANPGASPFERLLHLGASLEPDVLLLGPAGNPDPRLLAGAVCFPTSWAPEEKFGKGLEVIHGVVPKLNATLGRGISTFLERLKPGHAFERANWGLAATDALNLHPRLHAPRLSPTTPASQTWLRIEDQLLGALPDGSGYLFAIRLRLVPLPRVLEDPQLAPRFRRAVATMDPEVARYKGLQFLNFRKA